jgi:DNA modification methylase
MKMSIKILQGNCLETLSSLEEKSVNTCVTSPPYWGLRDYGTGEWVGGDPDCNHEGTVLGHNRNFVDREGRGSNNKSISSGDCYKCGAVRKDDQLGLEETPEKFVENLVNVFREVRRVLRDDGTVWLNLGDSYYGTGSHQGDHKGMHYTSRQCQEMVGSYALNNKITRIKT